VPAGWQAPATRTKDSPFYIWYFRPAVVSQKQHGIKKAAVTHRSFNFSLPVKFKLLYQ